MMRQIIIFSFFLLSLASYSNSVSNASFKKALQKFPFKGKFEDKIEFIRNLTSNPDFKQTENYYLLKYTINFFHTKKAFVEEALTLNRLGLLYNQIGKYSDAIQTFTNAQQLLQKRFPKNKNEVQHILYLLNINMGNSYYFVDQYDKSLLHYKKAFKAITSKTVFTHEDSLKIAKVYNNIGISYSIKNDLVSGSHYFYKSLRMNIKLQDSTQLASTLSNLASLHSNNNELDSALKKYLIAKSIYEKGGEKDDIAFIYNEIAAVYVNKKNNKLALYYALKALDNIDVGINSTGLVSTYKILNIIYDTLNDYKNENKYLKLYITAFDSINKRESISRLSKNEMINKFNTLHVTDSLKTLQELRIKDINIKAKKNQAYFLVSLLVFTILVLGLIYSRFKITKKQKRIIESQKNSVELKNKEITDSINYAKRIQTSLMPNEKQIDKTIQRLQNKKPI
jgi:tetratricopeptide (TPR) repeat protein